jgi:1,4-alpha-glucan branching enzyme
MYGYMWAHPGKKLLFMGCEFAQNDEWKDSESLQWFLTQFDEHRGIQKVVQSLNEKYRSIRALWERDTSPEGFTWLVNNDAASNIIAFVRWDQSRRPLVSITNFSPIPQGWYTMPFPASGTWREVMNTDDLAFGGSGISNGELTASAESGNHVTLKIPPLATIWLQLF